MLIEHCPIGVGGCQVLGSRQKRADERPAPAAAARTADVRSALVQAAVAVLERDGLPGLTVRAVAAEAGVAPMGVYNHLHGKDGLLVAALAQAFDNLTAAVTWPADLPPDEAFLETGRRYRRFALAAPVGVLADVRRGRGERARAARVARGSGLRGAARHRARRAAGRV